MKKKLLLINPDNDLTVKNFYEPIELGIIASLTPKQDWDVEIMDLRIDKFEFKKADLVAVTSRLLNAINAYEILAVFREKNITTVIGGMHASICPDEARKYADCVVVGEVESCWNDLLKDFISGSLKGFYYGSTNLEYQVDRTFYRHYYKTACLQFSRGCPLACDFCCVVKIHKQNHKFRNITYVIKEIKSIRQSVLFFTDENMYGFSKQNRDYAIELFKEMIKQRVKKKWIGMVSINAGLDNEFLFYARKSGCRLLIMGFEAENKNSLISINKTWNARYFDRYEEIVTNIHRNRIGICGVFMFGIPSDTGKETKERGAYILKSKIDSFLLTLYTPLPGSKVFEKFCAEKKLLYTNFPEDWKMFNFNTILFEQPNNKSLLHDFKQLKSSIRKPKFLTKKFFETIYRTKSLSAALFVNFYFMNHENEFRKALLLKWINQLFEFLLKYKAQ